MLEELRTPASTEWSRHIWFQRIITIICLKAPAGPHSAIFHYVGFAPWRAIDLNGSASRVSYASVDK